MNKKWLKHVLEGLHEDGYRWARQCCQYDEELAKEVMQEVYLKMLSGKAKYSERSSVKTWFYAVIRYTALDHLRNNEDMETLEKASNLIQVDEEQTLDFRSVLTRLSGKQSQVLLLVFYHNHTLEEVAEVMALSIGTVRTHYDRGKKNLKSILKEEYYG